MRIENAKELLPSFKFMEGMYCELYKKYIIDIFIGFREPNLTKLLYNNYRQGMGFPSLPSDFGNYTICAAFKDFSIEGVKTIIESEKIIELYEKAVILDYMDK